MTNKATSKMTVRRLAAVDMWGTRGTTRRRRIALAEFLVGLVGVVALGLTVLTASSSPGMRVFGLWMVGVGLNYVPLTAYAVRLIRPGALDAELAGVDTDHELRRYSGIQLWILVPLALVAIELYDRLRLGRT